MTHPTPTSGKSLPANVGYRPRLDAAIRRPQDRTRDEEADRLVALGATLVADHRRPDGTGRLLPADIEGNEFCGERSAGERARTGKQMG